MFGLAMPTVLINVKGQFMCFSLLKVADTRTSMQGRCKGGMVETLFLGTLSLELQVESGFLTRSGEMVNEYSDICT